MYVPLRAGTLLYELIKYLPPTLRIETCFRQQLQFVEMNLLSFVLILHKT